MLEIYIAGVRKRVRSGRGLGIPVQSIPLGVEPDMVVVPALSTTTPDSLVPALAGRDVLDAAEQLRAWHASGSAIAASCVGTFVLANAGLLDDGEATTTWWLGPLFRQRYPRILLDESLMIVSSGRTVTAGASMGHLDLALWLIRGKRPAIPS